MRERHSIRLVVPALLLVLLSSTPCLANPGQVLPVDIWMGDFARIVTVMAFDFVFDAFVLALAYMVLTRISLILTRDFLGHATWIFMAGLTVDLLLYGAAGGTITSGPGVVAFALLGFLGLGAFNYLICRTRSGFSPMAAIVVGVFVGILTNPVLFELALSVSGRHVDFMSRSGGF
jgi:hypothetical protein